MSSVKNFHDHFLRHRKVTEEVLGLFSDKDLDFKPWDNALSVKDLAIHIAVSTKMFAQTVLKGEFAPVANEQTEFTTVAELLQFFHQFTEDISEAFNQMTEEDLKKDVDVSRIFGQSVLGRFILTIMIEHEIHHKGQLFTYARMVGVEQLPPFIKR